ncbi:MAG: rhodanese domain-containing protein [Puniceicoccaceae bacterium 5H]|nr:MAG: rhodanese domain-containing protein [Puniceicoccaceae bacterium 5H]
MKSTHQRFLLLAALASTATVGRAATVEELADAIVAGDAPVLIDLRPTSAYQRGHIPGAISVPLAGLADRKLPPLGAVLVYGDGFGRQNTAQAVEVLAQKDGIQPDALEGGYAAWETRSGVTTAGAGMEPERPPMISYQELQAANAGEVVIYDLRQGEPQPEAEDGPLRAVAQVREPESITAHFPGATVRQGNPLESLGSARQPRSAALSSREGTPTRASAEGGNPLLKQAGPGNEQMIVLIDDDHHTAEDTARKLRAAGHKRVVVLAGGETILEHDGRAGSERMGGGTLDENMPQSEDSAD